MLWPQGSVALSCSSIKCGQSKHKKGAHQNPERWGGETKNLKASFWNLPVPGLLLVPKKSILKLPMPPGAQAISRSIFLGTRSKPGHRKFEKENEKKKTKKESHRYEWGFVAFQEGH